MIKFEHRSEPLLHWPLFLRRLLCSTSLGLFLVEKAILPPDQLVPPTDDLRAVAQRAAQGEAASLAFLTLQARAVKLGLAAPVAATLARSPLVVQAQKAVA